jgi:hypothetical protein
MKKMLKMNLLRKKKKKYRNRSRTWKCRTSLFVGSFSGILDENFLLAAVSKAKVIPKKFSVIRFEEEQTWYEARDDYVKEHRIAEGSEEKSLDKNGKFIRVLRERAEKLLKIESEVGAAKVIGPVTPKSDSLVV